MFERFSSEEAPAILLLGKRNGVTIFYSLFFASLASFENITATVILFWTRFFSIQFCFQRYGCVYSGLGDRARLLSDERTIPRGDFFDEDDMSLGTLLLKM